MKELYKKVIESSIMALTVGDFIIEKDNKKITLKSQIKQQISKMGKREIASFEMSAEYYHSSWINGNRNHVKQELKELNQISNKLFNRILFDLPKEIQVKIIDNL
jgi:hypothetical protein